ncbi:MAG: benzaldehyde dehydrogenase [Bradyrhizobium sp.]|nr:benzaldehyde dehydrogenase [Bradyrhizobium sp.]
MSAPRRTTNPPNHYRNKDSSPSLVIPLEGGGGSGRAKANALPAIPGRYVVHGPFMNTLDEEPDEYADTRSAGAVDTGGWIHQMSTQKTTRPVEADIGRTGNNEVVDPFGASDRSIGVGGPLNWEKYTQWQWTAVSGAPRAFPL